MNNQPRMSGLLMGGCGLSTLWSLGGREGPVLLLADEHTAPTASLPAVRAWMQPGLQEQQSGPPLAGTQVGA